MMTNTNAKVLRKLNKISAFFYAKPLVKFKRNHDFSTCYGANVVEPLEFYISYVNELLEDIRSAELSEKSSNYEKEADFYKWFSERCKACELNRLNEVPRDSLYLCERHFRPKGLKPSEESNKFIVVKPTFLRNADLSLKRLILLKELVDKLESILDIHPLFARGSIGSNCLGRFDA